VASATTYIDNAGRVLLVVWAGGAGCKQSNPHKNICPTDGQAPQWSKALSEGTCEYSHYREMERHTHMRTAKCENEQLPR